jgi:hypothetical protein
VNIWPILEFFSALSSTLHFFHIYRLDFHLKKGESVWFLKMLVEKNLVEGTVGIKLEGRTFTNKTP